MTHDLPDCLSAPAPGFGMRPEKTPVQQVSPAGFPRRPAIAACKLPVEGG